MRCYHKILHISYENHVTNEEVRAKIQQANGPHEDLLTIVKRRKLQWYGHVSCSSGLSKTILQGTVKGGRRQGKQRKRWEDNIREWTRLEYTKSQRVVENTEKWRKLVAKSSVVHLRPPRLRDRWWCILYLLYHWPLGNQSRCADLLLLITKASTTKWVYTDSSTWLTFAVSLGTQREGEFFFFLLNKATNLVSSLALVDQSGFVRQHKLVLLLCWVCFRQGALRWMGLSWGWKRSRCSTLWAGVNCPESLAHRGICFFFLVTFPL